MKYYRKVLDILFEILKWISAILIIAMVGITFIEVIRRYGLHKTWVWSEELVRYMIVWVTFLGGAAAFRKGGLTCFDLVVMKMPENVQTVLKYIVNTLTLLLCVFVLKYSIQVIQSPSIKLMKSSGLKFSMSYMYWAIPIGMIFMLVFGFDNYFMIHNESRQKKLQEEG